jgi:hypothetical protein
MTSLDEIAADLRRRRDELLERIEALKGYRARADDYRAQLEHPPAIADYITFFEDFFGRAAAELDRIAGELPAGMRQGHVDALRQLANNAAAEGRRCVQFRDKWINRPLPYEVVRPMLNQLSIDTRDQLLELRDLTKAAEALKSLAGPGGPPPDPPESLGRRELFNRILGREKTEHEP